MSDTIVKINFFKKNKNSCMPFNEHARIFHQKKTNMQEI